MPNLFRSWPCSVVPSTDGTPIGYRTIGKGPGLLVIPGSFVSSRRYARLARALSRHYTVHVMDRRGRGRSGPQGENYRIERECEDVAAVLEATGAVFVFGHSFGGTVALEAALVQGPAKLAVFEPGLSIEQSIPYGWAWEYKQAIIRRDYPEALVRFARGLGLVRALRETPEWLLRAGVRCMASAPGWSAIVSRLHTLEMEIREVARLDSAVGRYRNIGTETLIISGSESPAYLIKAVLAAKEAIPNARMAMLPCLGHAAPILAGTKTLARLLAEFFGHAPGHIHGKASSFSE